MGEGVLVLAVGWMGCEESGCCDGLIDTDVGQLLFVKKTPQLYRIVSTRSRLVNLEVLYILIRPSQV